MTRLIYVCILQRSGGGCYPPCLLEATAIVTANPSKPVFLHVTLFTWDLSVETRKASPSDSKCSGNAGVERNPFG